MIARLRADTRTLPVLATIVIVFGIFAAGNATFAQAGTYAAIFAIAAIGLSLLLGNVNQISLGAAGFFGIGAYSVASLTTWWNLPAWLSWTLATLIGIAGATIVGLGLGFIALRFRGHYLAMATLTFGLICAGIFHETPFFGAAVGIEDVPYPRFGALTISGYPAYWFAWILALGVALLTLNLLRGRSGRAFEAIRNDELAAEVLGVPTRRYKILAFAYSGALAGLAGAVYAAFLGIVVPDAVGPQLSFSLLLMVVLGGSGGVSGALIGAALLGFLDISGHQFENTREVVYGILVIGVVIAAPGGMFGLIRSRFAPRRAVCHPELVEGQPPSLMIEAAPRQARGDNGGDNGGAPLEVAHVTQRFGGLVAVNDVSFTLTRGTLTSLIGPNGAGKTTLFNAISGIGRPTEGRVTIGGSDVTGWQPHRVAALGVGRTFQNARLFGEMTVLENVIAGAFRTERTSFGADLFALPPSRRSEREATDRARNTLARLGLEPLASTLAKDLAFGDRRRVELARATASDPWLLLVDEPAAGLNAGERATLTVDLLKLRDAGMTLLLIEHDMRLVMSISERVMVLKFGTMIADGTADAVRNDPAVVAAYLGNVRLMLLEVSGLHAGYGELDVLRGISLTVAAGEMVAVLGPNGAGKSTLLRTISRIDTNVRSGSILFDGHDLLRASTVQGVGFGCLHVPEGRQLFTELSVDDNIRLGAFSLDRKTIEADVAGVYAQFPVLAERKSQTAFALSGGEQQMLAIGRALMAKPKLLMLDEPSTGLAPQIVAAIFGILAGLKRSGTAILIVEQNAYLTLQHADRAYVLENGEIALSGTAAELSADPRVRAIYLGGSAD